MYLVAKIGVDTAETKSFKVRGFLGVGVIFSSIVLLSRELRKADGADRPLPPPATSRI